MLFAEQMRSWGVWGQKRPNSAFNASFFFYSAIVRLNGMKWNQTMDILWWFVGTAGVYHLHCIHGEDETSLHVLHEEFSKLCRFIWYYIHQQAVFRIYELHYFVSCFTVVHYYVFLGTHNLLQWGLYLSNMWYKLAWSYIFQIPNIKYLLGRYWSTQCISSCGTSNYEKKKKQKKKKNMVTFFTSNYEENNP